jgi:hypothetical protein
MRSVRHLVLVCAALSLIATVARAQSRQPAPVGDETGPDAVGFRKKEVTVETVGDRRARANSPTTKQAIEDFMQIQKINQHIQAMLKSESMPLKDLASDAKDVHLRANRLKTSLLLPAGKEEKAEETIATSSDDLVSLIKQLNDNVRGFVTNPRFRNMQPADTTAEQLAEDAGIKLSRVIELSHVIQQSAEKLEKTTK